MGAEKKLDVPALEGWLGVASSIKLLSTLSPVPLMELRLGNLRDGNKISCPSLFNLKR